ncbi:protein-ADP-ribose hydrolase [Actinoplanes derwentensis]|uniref:Protein-ADP-ribose hydrolase n=1 Tax=Actinoplanes derwentensis TaxID=113562 RepID=A0A1H1YLI5_9ACTN|nr:protein-ADP-ribose hydrolase [Actinoplanes derwentensis]GID81194.1 hypothetical protein Ade03nite_01180 [Actinoplanes derwentensis]SDT22221.1 O-acetyl-ADP-ribose deacetylase (regulator of RNase III), contains Macro domain [Actinoplanes derwentensis]
MSTDRILARLGIPGGRGARERLRAALVTSAPRSLPPDVLTMLDELLTAESAGRTVTDAATLPTVDGRDRIVLWRGDITALRVDAIVNAANSALLGCFQPEHRCVDNVVHTAAGPRLRDECHTLMTEQGFPEPTGSAKITSGYHLPARYVLHTVGPIVRGPVTPGHEAALASAYRSCLDLAATRGDIRGIAFCSISTGLFGFPPEPAARIAVATVTGWLAAHPGRLDRVVFDVWTADDHACYQKELTHE